MKNGTSQPITNDEEKLPKNETTDHEVENMDQTHQTQIYRKQFGFPSFSGIWWKSHLIY